MDPDQKWSHVGIYLHLVQVTPCDSSPASQIGNVGVLKLQCRLRQHIVIARVL